MTNIQVKSLMLGGLIFGVSTSGINGMTSPIQEYFQLTSNQVGFLVMSFLIGCSIGAILFGYLSEIKGRFFSFTLCLSVTIVSILSSSLSSDFNELVVSRSIWGIGIGGISFMAPLLISEVSSHKNRISNTGMNEVVLASGQLLVFITNGLIAYLFTDCSSWRWMTAVQVIPVIIAYYAFGTYFYNYEFDSDSKPSSIKWTSATIKLLIVGCIWACIQQLTGVNVLMYYGTDILELTGFGQLSAAFNIFLGISTVIGMYVGVKYLCPKFNLKEIVIIGLLIISCFYLTLAQLGETGSHPIATLILMCSILLVMQSTLGYLTWVVLAHMFPEEGRGKLIGISAAFNWLSNAIISYNTPSWINSYTLSSICSIAAVITVYSAWFVLIFVKDIE